jgi:hypothetical protein
MESGDVMVSQKSCRRDQTRAGNGVCSNDDPSIDRVKHRDGMTSKVSMFVIDEKGLKFLMNLGRAWSLQLSGLCLHAYSGLELPAADLLNVVEGVQG